MFGFGKKKEGKKSCCCGSSCSAENISNAEALKCDGGIKVLGGGCTKCHELEANVRSALEQLGRNDNVELITDYAVIASYGVMTTPALVINGKVVSYGKVLKKEEVVAVLEEK